MPLLHLLIRQFKPISHIWTGLGTKPLEREVTRPSNSLPASHRIHFGLPKRANKWWYKAEATSPLSLVNKGMSSTHLLKQSTATSI